VAPSGISELIIVVGYYYTRVTGSSFQLKLSPSGTVTCNWEITGVCIITWKC